MAPLAKRRRTGGWSATRTVRAPTIPWKRRGTRRRPRRRPRRNLRKKMLIPRIPTTYSRLYTYLVAANSMGSPGTLYNLTDWSKYTGRFDSEGTEKPSCRISKAWLTYQIDGLTTGPSPLVVHLWLLKPRATKLQSCLPPTLAVQDVTNDIDCQADGSNPLLNYNNYRVKSYRRHIVGVTTTPATSFLSERTRNGAMRLPLPKFVKNVAGNQNWKQVTTSEVPFYQQTYLFVYLEVQSSVTNTNVQFSFNATMNVQQAV